MRKSLAGAAALLAALVLLPAASGADDLSLRFYGHGVAAPGLDRVKIPIDPQVPLDVGGDFTLEFWLSAEAADNTSGACSFGADNWITGNVLFDRDVFGAGDYGDYGVSLHGGVIAFGASDPNGGDGICGDTGVADGTWHHVAVQRESGLFLIDLWVDGKQEAVGFLGTGDVSYRDGRATSYPNSDPYLVIGAEKHDVDPNSPSYNGYIDEVRVSNFRRYGSEFTPPTGPFAADANTVALYHFDEGPVGACTGPVQDSSGASGGPSPGSCSYGGAAPSGPVYSAYTPFASPVPVGGIGFAVGLAAALAALGQARRFR